jgi:hypothetical protein
MDFCLEITKIWQGLENFGSRVFFFQLQGNLWPGPAPLQSPQEKDKQKKFKSSLKYMYMLNYVCDSHLRARP